MKQEYNQKPIQVVKGKNREVSVFSTSGENIDLEVVQSFGDEWSKFHDFPDETINDIALEYFDIVGETMVNKNTYALDIGCGTGRWTRFLTAKAGFIEAIDPSHAIFAADTLLSNISNVRLTKASTDNIPFNDETFDFAMSVGVLHHIPDTQKAMQDCVKKVKKGGYFYCYLYHNLESRGIVFKTIFNLSELIRKVVCKLPAKLKRAVCDILAIVIYMPLILLLRLFWALGFKKLAMKIPLSGYKDKSFFVIRNDSLDKFGTKLEQRFSKQQVIDMMVNSGLSEIVVSPISPYYHAVGKKI